MSLHNLKPAAGSTFTKKRLGRGEGSGSAGTAGRGHKGAKSRSGYSKKIGFEGGQMPLQRRVPKFGFTNPNRIEYRGINLDTLMDNGLAGKHDLVKILGRGKITSAIDVRVNKVSESAKKAIEKAGGTIYIITNRPENEEASVPSKSSEKVTKQ